MGINHGSAYVFVPHQLLDASDVISAFQQMGHKEMAERMTLGMLEQASLPNRFTDRLLYHGPLHAMATLFAGVLSTD